MQRGPILPYNVVAGAIPCHGRWLTATAKMQGSNIAPEVPQLRDSFVDLVDEKPAFSIIAIQAPIGYLDEVTPGGRTCDQQARALLGPRRGASIHSAPSLSLMSGGGHSAKVGIDAVSRILLNSYRDVATEMAPFRQRTIYEVHAELTFYQLNGDVPLRYSKHSDLGRAERRDLIASRFPGSERILEAVLPGVTEAHLLDAAACLWTARRLAGKAAIRLPADPEWDSQGLRMEIMR